MGQTGRMGEMGRVGTMKISFVKVLVFLLVAGIIAGSLMLVSGILRPRGEARIRQQLEEARQARAGVNQEIALLSEKLSAGKAGEAEAPRPNVSVLVLRETRIQDILLLPAVAEAYEDILLAARNDGTVEWLGPREGQSVRKGQEIARIDAIVLVQILRSAEAAEKLAEVSFKRTQDLTSKNVVSAGELDTARSRLDQARAATAIARQNFEDATLLSPIDGVVDDVRPDVGEFVKRGETVARLVDVSRIKMNLHVPERDIGRFRPGQQSAVMRPEPYEGVTTGTITRIALVADDPSKTFLMEVTLDNPDGAFRPGMITKAQLIRRNHTNALVIPAFSVLPTENGPIVYVEENGVTRARRVEIGIRRGMEFEISKGLKPGDRLIVAGQRNLSDGSPVRVVREHSGDLAALPMYSSEDRIPAIAGDPATSRTESTQAGKTR